MQNAPINFVAESYGKKKLSTFLEWVQKKGTNSSSNEDHQYANLQTSLLVSLFSFTFHLAE